MWQLTARLAAEKPISGGEQNEATNLELRRILDEFRAKEHLTWFLFKIPAAVEGQWRNNDRNEELVEGALETATISNLGNHNPDVLSQEPSSVKQQHLARQWRPITLCSASRTYPHPPAPYAGGGHG